MAGKLFIDVLVNQWFNKKRELIKYSIIMNGKKKMSGTKMKNGRFKIRNYK